MQPINSPFLNAIQEVKEPVGLKPGAVKVSVKRPIHATITDPARPSWKETRGPDGKVVKEDKPINSPFFNSMDLGEDQNADMIAAFLAKRGASKVLEGERTMTGHDIKKAVRAEPIKPKDEPLEPAKRFTDRSYWQMKTADPLKLKKRPITREKRYEEVELDEIRMNDNYGKASKEDMEKSQNFWSGVKAQMDAKKKEQTKPVVKKLGEISPPGWEGTVKAMKKHPEITNPWALSWWMKNRGDKSHYTKDAKEKVMKRLADFRPKQKNNPDPPALLMLKRKYIRMFPGNIKVGVYKSDQLKQFITIPFSDMQLGEAVEAPEPFKDNNLEILKNIIITGKDDTICFSDKSEYDVDVETANAILSIYARCSDENKKKMKKCLTKGVGGFMKLAKFAMQNQ